MPVPQPAASASATPAVHAHIAAEDALYPCSDGKPMSENMWQGPAILKAAGDLEVAHPGALVAPDILVYPEQGNPRNRVAPDVLVAFGLGAHNRSTYLVWKEGKPPDWVLEVASPSTVGRDLDAKRRIYAAIGVPEYWQFDPQGGLFPLGAPRLRGLTLVDGEYEPLAARLERGAQTIHSPVLGLDLRTEGALIRFRNLRPARTCVIKANPKRPPSSRRRVRGRKQRDASPPRRSLSAKPQRARPPRHSPSRKPPRAGPPRRTVGARPRHVRLPKPASRSWKRPFISLGRVRAKTTESSSSRHGAPPSTANDDGSGK